MDDNNFDDSNVINEEENLTKNQKAEIASHDVAEVAARVVGRYFGVGPVVDKALKTKRGQKIVGVASKKVARTPGARSSLARSYSTVRKVKPIAHTVLDHVGGTGKNSSGASTAESNNSTSSYDNHNNLNTSGLWSSLSLKVKLIVICVIFVILFLGVFLLLFIAPLMHLEIIDIDKGGSSSGLGYSSNTYLKNIYNSCKTIVADGQAWALEDYVAGVVTGESWGDDQPIEALKAQAIAARTYAIYLTNNCQKSIGTTDAAQVFVSDPEDSAVEATQATAGLVMTYNSKLFLSEYDSFYKGRNYSCDSEKCSVTYRKHPNYEEHIVSIPISLKWMAAGGHGYGMSQVASYAMAAEGYNFEEILKFFYSPGVQINSLYGSDGYTSGLSASGDFMMRTGMPVQGNEHDDNFYFSNANASYAGGYVGECTWYAYGRANEILSYAGSDLKWVHAPHAKNWFDYNLNSGSNAFSYSTDVTEPKEGAIIVWSSNQFGHVAVVEKVNDDGTLDYSEANIHSVKSSSNPYGFRYQSNISYTETGVGTMSSIWSGYKFVGYIYMVE